MLIEFSVANFKSIKDRQTLSLVASKNNELADTEPFDTPRSGGDIKLLPSVAIYGANAAGKTNLLGAPLTMRIIVLESALELRRGDLLPVKSFMLDSTTRNAPTEFEVNFIAEGVRYQYGFSATKERIVDEWLLAYPKNRRQNWFVREWDEEKKKHKWDFGTFLIGEKNLWQKSTRDNALFLSTAVQLNSQQLQPIFDWFKNTIRRIGLETLNPAFSASLCATDEKKEKVLAYLQAADLGIDNIQVEETTFGLDNLPNDMPTSLKKEIVKKMENEGDYEIKMVHHSNSGEIVKFDFDEESNGTQKFFAFAGPWIEVLANGCVLIVDELHDNLHPKLVKYLVSLFNNKKTNPHNAQLIFTTHETAILNQETLRRDQVWFCEKDKTQATLVYPLSDFRTRTGRGNLELEYLSGRYGAVPYVEEI